MTFASYGQYHALHRGNAGLSALTRFDSPPATCWLGDSRTDLSTREAPQTVIWSTGSYVGWLRWLLGPRIETDQTRVLGKSAMTSEHWLAVQVPQAIAQGCRLAIHQIGSNDISKGQSAGDVMTRITQGQAALHRAGIMSVFVSVLPTNHWVASQMGQVDALNDALWDLAQRSGGNMAFVDARSRMVDPATGRVRDGLLVDGVHDSSRGGSELAAAVFPALDAILPKAVPAKAGSAKMGSAKMGLESRAGLLANGDFSLAGGSLRPNATGVVAKSWACGAINDASAVQIACGLENGQALLSLTGVGDGKRIGFTQVVTVPASDKDLSLSLQCDARWSGGAGITSLGTSLTANAGGQAFHVEDGDGTMKNDGGLIPGPFPEEGRALLSTPVLKIPAGVRTVNAAISARTTAAAPMDVKIAVSNCHMDQLGPSTG